MGNILATVISYDQTDIYVFKDTNDIVTTLCRIKFMEVESVPATAATDWTISSTTNALNASKYDVTLEYRPSTILSDFTLPVYDSVITNNTKLTTFIPLAFILNSNTIIATPNESNPTFTVTVVDTIAIIVDNSAFDNAIFRVTTTETEIYGYVRDQSGNDVAVTENESVTATSKNYNNQNRLELTSITLTKGRWLVEATGSFDCSHSTQVHFWFDVGGLLNELTLVPQYRDSLRTFNSQSNSNMSITMQSEFFFDDSIRLYWCTTPDTAITSSIFSTTIPNSLPSGTTFIDYAIGNGGTNNAKITAISLSDV
ncbi:hypothetical protein N9064_00115 [bacterium]|nr:hypothetical protein [bacterium]